MIKKYILSFLAAILAISGVAVLSAFESRIINVTARISGDIDVDTEEIDFGTVPAEGTASQSIEIALADFTDDLNSSSVSCDSENLIKNGSFEKPVVQESAGWDIFETGEPNLKWKVKWESTEISYDGQDRPDPVLEIQRDIEDWEAQEGEQYAELDTDWDGPGGSLSGEPALVEIYQDISTEEGVDYKLSYYFSARPGTSEAENVLIVEIGDQEVSNHVASGIGSQQTQWNYFERTFEAEEAKTRISFVAGGVANGTGILLDNVKLVKCSGSDQGELNYVIYQKPKCVDKTDPEDFVPAIKDGDDFKCPSGYKKLPVLCPFLSKTESTLDNGGENDGSPVLAFHGSVDDWDVEDTEDFAATGKLTSSDILDEWIIGLEAPCFEGFCSTDWSQEGYELDPNLESELLGCDLVIEFFDNEE